MSWRAGYPLVAALAAYNVAIGAHASTDTARLFAVAGALLLLARRGIWLAVEPQ